MSGRRGSAQRWILGVLTLGLVACGAAAMSLDHSWPHRPPAVDVTVAGRPTPSPEGAPNPLPRSAPARLEIPKIGVRTGLVPLGVEPDGALQVPTDFAVAGWYTLGPTPGQVGPAVVAGHIDSYRGPAVFFRLSALRPGDQVRVARQDGLVAVFRVYAVGRYPKTAFPTGQVYANTDVPELRLITCGGAFDARARSYVDNVVVYAALTTAERG